MICQVCASDNEEGSRFCRSCGNPVSEPTPHNATNYGMVSFTDAIRLGFQRYFDFRGRSTRAEYWWWVLFIQITYIAFYIPAVVFESWFLSAFYTSFGLVTWIPGLALAVRRLHDINRSGWWIPVLAFSMILIIPAFVALKWILTRSNDGTNKYGPDPRIELFE